MTGLQPDLHTVVLRVIGRVRGTALDVRADTVASAVLASTERYPYYPLAPDRQRIEVDLRQLPGEAEARPGYYESAARQIDEAIATLLRPGIERGLVDHLSVFAFARLPVLVYLGSRLDDSQAVDVYDRHRPSESWAWPTDGVHVDFAHDLRRAGDTEAREALLIINASGSTDPKAIPATLADLPVWVIEPVGTTPAVGTVGTRSTLASFEKALRALLGDLERSAKQTRRLHLLAAAPLSVAVTLGRAVGWGIHPTVVVYDLVDGTYEHALEVMPP